jgi:uncharacterized membrane protein YgaE (UPF0421/DUF939 family)
MNNEFKNLLIYIAKCVTGCIAVFLLSRLFNYSDISWCIISVMLVLTPDSTEAVPLVLTRIKANLIAGASSLLCLIIFPANAFTIILAIVITILGCFKFKVMTGSRSAIAAVIIIMLHDIETNQTDFWSITIARIVSVVVGCAIGLIVTLLFHKKISNINGASGKTEEG